MAVWTYRARRARDGRIPDKTQHGGGFSVRPFSFSVLRTQHRAHFPPLSLRPLWPFDFGGRTMDVHKELSVFCLDAQSLLSCKSINGPKEKRLFSRTIIRLSENP
jgi:hypothetical protein